jgi:hypothetical protein
MIYCVNMFARLLVKHSTLWDPNLFSGLRDFTTTLERISIKIGGTMSEGAAMDPPWHLPPTINTMREKLISICTLVGESSKTMSGGSPGLATTPSPDSIRVKNMVMDKKTEALLLNFLGGEHLM